MIVKITPKMWVNPDNVETLNVGDGVNESRIIWIQYVSGKVDVLPAEDFDIDQIVSLLNGFCTYNLTWTDEVGNIDVCVLHGNNSRHRQAAGPNRPCLTVDPYPEGS